MRRPTGAPCKGRTSLRVSARVPVSITLDGDAASHRAVRELPAQNPRWKDTRLRSSKYLNNMIEQDHRGVKSRANPMLGMKVFDRAAVTIAGVELLHHSQGTVQPSPVARSRPIRARGLGTRYFRPDRRDVLAWSFGHVENSHQSLTVDYEAVRPEKADGCPVAINSAEVATGNRDCET